MNSRSKNGKRILVVDDEPDITMVISIILESRGFEIDSFNDPMLALSKFQPDCYNLVLLDIRMPKMDGFELYNNIKKIDSHVVVCFLSASDRIYCSNSKTQINNKIKALGESIK